MLVHHFLEHSAKTTSEAPAVWYQDQWMTYGEINDLADRVAQFLVEQGIEKGDGVALLYENSFDYIIHYYGILKAGAITVALNTASTVEKLIYLLNDSGAKAVVSNQKFTRKLMAALPAFTSLEFMLLDHEEAEGSQTCPIFQVHEIYQNTPNRSVLPEITEKDLASIVYTSGSTGKPKGVTLSHLNLVTNTRSIVQYLKLTARDRMMVVLPFYYIYGKSLLNTHFAVGGSLVIDNRFAFPAAVLDTMQKTEVTGFAGVPSNFMILLERSNIREHRFEHLRYVTQAGGGMPVPVQQEVARVFDPARLYIMYGATEASARLSYLDPDELPRKWGSIGKAIPDVTLSVLDENSNEVPVGHVGEIVARGKNIMQGYWNDPVETAQVLKNGIYYTGDLGYKDEEGFFFIVGRKKEMIKTGGERVSPKEIEDCFYHIPEVQEAAVIGVEDAILGEAIHAFIVLKSNATITKPELEKGIKKQLAPYMHPREIHLVDALPKNESGKILKTRLKLNEEVVG